MESAIKITVPRPATDYIEPARVAERHTEPPPREVGWTPPPSVWDLKATIEWLIADMIPLKGITLISGPSGTGKSWLSCAVGGAVAHGQPFLGREVQQRPVLYLDRENPLAIVKRNLEHLAIARTDGLSFWGGWHEGGPPGPDDPGLIQFAEQHQPLITFDSLVRFHTGDEQSAKETSAFMKLFRHLANRGATILLLHHTGKSPGSKKYRGSSDIEAAVDMAYTLDGQPRAGLLHRLTLTNFKSRFASGKNFGMEFQVGRGFEAVEEHPGMNGDGIKELAEAAGVGRNAADRVLKTLPHRKGKGREKLYDPPEEVLAA
jgi:AAA domain